jgi:hypothetical protein
MAGFQLSINGRFSVSTEGETHGERIEMIDPLYYTVADGVGQTTAARKAGIDVGVDERPAVERCASLLHTTESDPRPT